VVWGALHGAYLLLERALKRIVPRRLTGHSFLQMPAALATFLLICVASVFFRADSLGKAWHITATLLGFGPDGATRLLRPESIVISLGVTLFLLSIHWLMRNRSLTDVVTYVPWWARSLVLAAMILGVFGLSGEDRAFLYFQF
jgi:alginate O-acetyltransferase complex protein AlgI